MKIRNYTGHPLVEIQYFLEGASMLFNHRPRLVELHPTRLEYGGQSHWKPEPWLQLFLPFTINDPKYLAWLVCHEFQHLQEMEFDPEGRKLEYSWQEPIIAPWHLRPEEHRANQAADRLSGSLLVIVGKLANRALPL